MLLGGCVAGGACVLLGGRELLGGCVQAGGCVAPGGCVAAGACVVGGEVKGACVSALGASVVVGDSDGGLVLEGRGVGGYRQLMAELNR